MHVIIPTDNKGNLLTRKHTNQIFVCEFVNSNQELSY